MRWGVLTAIQTLQKIKPEKKRVIHGIGVSKRLSLGRNLNIIQEQFFDEPYYTKLLVESLKYLQWVRHTQGYTWPDCACLACCGELIIKVMEEASETIRAS